MQNTNCSFQTLRRRKEELINLIIDTHNIPLLHFPELLPALAKKLGLLVLN